MKNRNVLQIETQGNFNIASSDLAYQIAYAVKSRRGAIITSFLNKEDRQSTVPLTLNNGQIQDVYWFGFSKKQLKGSRRKIIRVIDAYVKKMGFDTIIAHRFKPISTALALNALASNKLRQIICVVHGIGDYDRRYRRWLIRWFVKDNCYFVAVSEPVRQYLLGLNCGLTESNTVTINNAIDIQHIESIQLTKEQARDAFDIDSKKRVVGTIGRLVPVKDHQTLIRAIALLKDKYPNLLLVIIGGGRLEQKLKQLISSLGLNEQVLLVGETPEAVKYAKAFDVFALTSLSEGLPIALLEGMIAKLPVVGSDIPSIEGIIKGVGKVYKVSDVRDLANKLTYYLAMSDDDLHDEGERLYDHVCQQYKIEGFRSEYISVLSALH